jgi:hypothetical protein
VTLNPAYVDWCRAHFAMLKDGGVWGVPRSGLIFTRCGDALVLTARMPHDPAMPLTAAELDKQQHDDFAGIKLHFDAAGVPTTWECEP